MSPDTPRCPHGYPSPLSCLDCMEDGNLPPIPKPVIGVGSFVFRAQYEGTCRGCGMSFLAGQEIRHVTVDGEAGHGHVHDGCTP